MGGCLSFLMGFPYKKKCVQNQGKQRKAQRSQLQVYRGIYTW